MDKIIVLDFGGQYCHLIARRIRDLGVYSEIVPYDLPIEKLKELNPQGIILSGGPNSVYDQGSPQLKKELLDIIIQNKIPMLGICYGHHLIAYQLGGIIEPRERKEYGRTEIDILYPNLLLDNLEKKEVVWMSHGDQVKKLPRDFQVLAKTDTCPIAAYINEDMKLYGVQFHPEVIHTVNGHVIFENFITKIANAKKQWKLENWIYNTIDDIKRIIGPNNKVILGLSGGVDSSVAALILHKAIGDRLHCVFVNNGLLRKNEEIEVQKLFKEKLKFINFHYIDAEKIFLEKLQDIEDPEKKREVIGHTFIEVFEKKTIELEKLNSEIKFLAQGTIYPDRVETASTSKFAAKIKSHHNLTLPEKMKLIVIEPLKELYKDEVRQVGLKMGLDKDLVDRHPFPGPGLAVRLIGPVDKKKLDILRDADVILIDEIKKCGIYEDLWQAFCVFLPVKTVGIMGDYRTYENICALRIVQSKDAMTANFAKIDWNLLEKISTRIINEVKGFNRVVYDISNKPPSTIEYE